MFFFFKQKTAYEMRISDWSSDVCSSDLVALPLARADMVERERGQRFGEPRQLMVMRCEEATAFVHLMHRLDHRPGERKPVIGRGAAPDLVQYDEALRGRLREDRRGLDHLDQIGRASCRERVCQYV